MRVPTWIIVLEGCERLDPWKVTKIMKDLEFQSKYEVKPALFQIGKLKETKRFLVASIPSSHVWGPSKIFCEKKVQVLVTRHSFQRSIMQE